jgi:hypothetical protein
MNKDWMTMREVAEAVGFTWEHIRQRKRREAFCKRHNVRDLKLGYRTVLLSREDIERVVSVDNKQVKGE